MALLEAGAVVQVNQLSRNASLRGLFGQVERSQLRGTTPYARIRILGLADDLAGETPLWWIPAAVLDFRGADPSCMDPMEAQLAARSLLPFLFGRNRMSTQTVEASVAISEPKGQRWMSALRGVKPLLRVSQVTALRASMSTGSTLRGSLSTGAKVDLMAYHPPPHLSMNGAI